MKIALLIIALTLAMLACGCTAAVPSTNPAAATRTTAPTLPNLVGPWTGTMLSYDENAGFSDINNAPISLVVTGQQGRIFAGHFVFMFNGTPSALPCAGGIGRNGRTFVLAGKEDGYTNGEILSDNGIELTCLHDKTPFSASIDMLKRA